ncbi:hypothetical protein ATCC90586_004887 [Pythium insidiosum]|nr:hypothetical protein ATCC90586_004887 [Pythium insidiosum]
MAAVLQRDSLSALLLDDDMDMWLEEPMVEPTNLDILAVLMSDDEDGDRIPRSRATLDEIQHASWRVLSCEKQNARLYSSRVVAKIVQRVNADTYVYARNSPIKDGCLNVRYFSLHSQMEYRTEANERATVTLMLLLDKEPLMVDDAPGHKGPPVIWLKEGTSFVSFTEKTRLPHETEDAIEIEYGSSIHCLNEEHAQYLMVEIVSLLMRWEHLVIPPRLLKPDC